ncbi:hypothetical protein [Photobacterium andalusiense]|uniref:Uncharacterized protein n=1 Tax=Photobacterium andalusiense TaxID=2204296 RepID=A0A1Y6MHB7_9GAMM|nr:hypothetical protein [Photobacterium andalusiense]SMY35188.1 hypothetical protein PAND9192_01856 [Photobacterium andalusiense]
MSDNKTALKVSDKSIEEGIAQGNFKEDGTLIRDVSNGQIVKVLKKKEESLNYIPSTFVQVHHNYIYQADLSPILEAISHERESSLYNELEEQYNLVLDYLDSFNTYNTGIEKVHQICLEISVSFDNKIRREIEALNIDELEKIDSERFVGSLNAYVKILFSYIVSTYILHRDKFSKDKVIISKILSFEGAVRSLYEQVLAKSTKEKNKDGELINIIPMEESLYSMYLFNDDYDLHDLDRLVSYDSRFSTSLQLINFFKKHFKSGRFQGEGYGYRECDEELKISIKTKEISKESNRNKIAVVLLRILEDIEKLKEIREEVVSLKNLPNEDVLQYYSVTPANKKNQSDA